MKNIQGLRYAKGEDKPGFCCYNGNVVIDEETPTPRAQEILDLWEENSVKGRVLRKYVRQINNTFALASFGSKEVQRDGYNPSYIIQGTTYMGVGSLYLSENNTPSYTQIYLYNPTNDNDQTRVDIRLN